MIVKFTKPPNIYTLSTFHVQIPPLLEIGRNVSWPNEEIILLSTHLIVVKSDNFSSLYHCRYNYTIDFGIVLMRASQFVHAKRRSIVLAKT